MIDRKLKEEIVGMPGWRKAGLGLTAGVVERGACHEIFELGRPRSGVEIADEEGFLALFFVF